MKVFLWRVCHDIIPTRGNLTKRYITDESGCQAYGYQFESFSHTLLLCLVVEKAWANSPFTDLREAHHLRHFLDVLWKLQRSLYLEARSYWSF